MIINPTICMRSYIVPVLYRRYPHSRVVFEGFADSVESVFDVVLIEEPQEPPNTRTGAIIILRFGVDRSLANMRNSTSGFADKGFRAKVTIKYSILCSLNSELASKEREYLWK